MIFPDTKITKILKLQEKLKKYIVSEGYMIGEFYESNLQAGLHNKEFFPLQTIVGCIALRKMVVGNKIFLDSEKYDETTRKEYTSGGETPLDDFLNLIL